MKTGNENKNPAHKWERLVSNRTHQHYSSGALSAWIHKWVRWMWWMMWSLTSRSLRLSTLPDLFSFSTRCSSALTEYNQSAERTSNHVQYSRAHFQRLWVVTTQWWWLEHEKIHPPANDNQDTKISIPCNSIPAVWWCLSFFHMHLANSHKRFVNCIAGFTR